jgi:CRP-like cAMP-binding protein
MTPAEVAQELAPYERLEVHPPGTRLFAEGDEPAGIYYLHSGEVDLCFAANRDEPPRPLITCAAGQMLGLTALVTHRRHDSTATTSSTCIVGYLEAARFLQLLDEKPALWLTILQLISTNINTCWDCMRSLGK